MPTAQPRKQRPAVAGRQFRDALAQFATGVTVITARAPHGFVGFTANSFNSVSLDPPLVMVAVKNKSRMHPHLEHARGFAVNVLSESQEALSNRFAGGRVHGGAWSASDSHERRSAGARR